LFDCDIYLNNALFATIHLVERLPDSQLDTWLTRPDRKPLILRGARQVGKTWLVRELARRSGRELVEINFERDPRLARHFASNDPREILNELMLALARDITPDRSLLFLDEIQAAESLLGKLRWFAEELPELPVVAAGSLLDLSLGEHEYSVPVGRVSYLYIEPMGFQEFLTAHGQTRVLEVLSEWSPDIALSPASHEQATAWFHRYTMVGGMPAVVAADVAGATPEDVRRRQRELIAAYRDDFAKYARRLDRVVLDGMLLGVAASLGRKFVYAHAVTDIKQQQARRALELLAAARVCHLVRHTAANGLPLGGQVKDTFRKVILLDVGLLHALVGTPAGPTFPQPEQVAPGVRGQVAEQVAGQTLRLLSAASGSSPGLYYWQRDGGRPGEIDYLVELDARVVPVELKSGASGAMKSLHQFMHDKGLDLAVRLDANPPSVQRAAVRTTQGDDVRYTLVNLPHYLAFRTLEAVVSVRDAS